jgi:hypothetical protein
MPLRRRSRRGRVASRTGCPPPARWDGPAWSALGSGTGGAAHTVRALAVYDHGSGGGPALHAAGSFSTAGGSAAKRIAKWDGSGWSPLGAGLSALAQGLSVFDDGHGPALSACGYFLSAGGAPASQVARWHGSDWSALGSGIP